MTPLNYVLVRVVYHPSHNPNVIHTCTLAPFNCENSGVDNTFSLTPQEFANTRVSYNVTKHNI